jgi:hypothetical protein
VILIAANQIGRVHHAAQHSSLVKTRPCYCFVPEEFFQKNGFEKGRYLASRWPGINCSANPLGIGSHILPDPQKTVSNRTRCQVLREFLWRLEIVATVKTATPE